jgi:ABC-type amino acid transport substrate-binding protein
MQGQEADEQWRVLEEEKQTVENNHQREKDALLANQRAEAAVGDGSIGSGRMSQ